MSDLDELLANLAELAANPNVDSEYRKDARDARDLIHRLEAIVTDLASINPHHHTAVKTLRRRAREAGVVATGDNHGD